MLVAVVGEVKKGFHDKRTLVVRLMYLIAQRMLNNSWAVLSASSDEVDRSNCDCAY